MNLFITVPENKTKIKLTLLMIELILINKRAVFISTQNKFVIITILAHGLKIDMINIEIIFNIRAYL